MGAGIAACGIASYMSDFQEQLAELRRRVAKIDRKYAQPKAARREPPAPSPEPPEAFPWEEIETEHGRHYEAEKLEISPFEIGCSRSCGRSSRSTIPMLPWRR